MDIHRFLAYLSLLMGSAISILPMSVRVMEGSMSVRQAPMDETFSDLCGLMSEVLAHGYTKYLFI